MAAYAAQGLALFTGGIMVVYTGITRGVLLLIEAFLLGVAGAFAGDRILTISTYVASFFATMFLIWEIAVNAHHPWLLGFSGAAVMLINAWNSRSEVRDSPVARTTIVVSTSCYCIMAVGLIYTSLSTVLGESTLPPALAIAALVLTFSIYQFSVYELPPTRANASARGAISRPVSRRDGGRIAVVDSCVGCGHHAPPRDLVVTAGDHPHRPVDHPPHLRLRLGPGRNGASNLTSLP